MSRLDVSPRLVRPVAQPGPSDVLQASLRALTATGVLINAVLHLVLWADGFSSLRVVGPLFLLDAVAGVLLAVPVLAWLHWLPLAAAAGYSAAALAAFAVSVAVGLFGVHETLSGAPQMLAVVAESATVLVAGAAWSLERRTSFGRS